MRGIKIQLGTGLQEPAGLHVEHVRIPSNLMHRPGHSRALVLRVGRQHPRMVDREQPTDRGACLLAPRLGHFLVLDRGDIPVLGQTSL